MRAILIAMLTAAGIGLPGTAGMGATLPSGSALLNALEDQSPFELVQRGRGGNFRSGNYRGGSTVVVRGFRGGGVRVHGGRYWRGGRWWYWGGCSYELWIRDLCD